MNSVYIDSAVAASPIYIGPTNANSIIIGNANSTNTTLLGKTTHIAKNTTGVNPTYFEMASETGYIYMDFHSNSTYTTDYDTRIFSNGGTATLGQGALSYSAATHSFYGSVNMTSGSTVENGLIVKSYTGATQGQITFNNTHTAGGANFYVGHDSYTSGNFVIKVGGGQGVYLVAGGTGWTGYSDIRLKKNIEPIENSLEKICNITPIYFEYIKSDISMNYVGFSAQEVETQFPIIVTDDENGIKMIQPTSFIPYLVQSIKELKHENDDLKQKYSEQQTQIIDLKTKNELLESQVTTILQRLAAAGVQ
jgi:FtsZ-binding cell division protein ZapB